MTYGNFTAQDKLRAGAYINFKASRPSMSGVGDRGVVAIPLPLSWGSGIIEVTAEELRSGASATKIGITANDTESLALRLALENASKVLLYRVDTDGSKATNVLELAPENELAFSAKYAGSAGNKIKIVIKEEPITGGFEVLSYMGSILSDVQYVTDAGDLADNDIVEFTGTGALVATAGVTLEGGTNGVVSAEDYTDALNEFAKYSFDVIAMVGDTASYNTTVEARVRELRDTLGIKVQAVLQNANSNYEGIISVSQGVVIDGQTIDVGQFVAWVAGITASAGAGQSNTYREVFGATDIVDTLTNSEIEDALKAGKFVISKRRDGVVVVERDINTLYNPTGDSSSDIQNNSILRTLDTIHNYVIGIWENRFIGKVSNTADGRATFKSTIIDYLSSLNAANVIDSFSAEEDVIVEEGIQPEGVLAQITIKPAGAMEKLYMTVIVG